MSYVYRQDLNWLVSEFAARVTDVAHAIVVTADGVPLALSQHIPETYAEQLAAITSGLTSLSDGSSLAVLASRECDTSLVAYEMTLLVEAVGEVLTPARRAPEMF